MDFPYNHTNQAFGSDQCTRPSQKHAKLLNQARTSTIDLQSSGRRAAKPMLSVPWKPELGLPQEHFQRFGT